MRPRASSSAYPVLLLVAAGCGPTRPQLVPKTAMPPPPPASTAAPTPAPKADGPSLYIPVPRAVRPRTKAESLQVLAGPCAWNPGYLADWPTPVMWRVDPAGDAAPLEGVEYGVTPAGYRSAVAAEPLTDGCYCVRLEPCCDANAELEVRAGVGRATCERWATEAMPLPPGALNAYEFTDQGREEHAWEIRGRRIEISATEDQQRSGKPLAHLTASLRPWPDAPLTSLVPSEGEPQSGFVLASHLSLEGECPSRDLYVRWIGDRQPPVDAMLVDRSGEHRVTLLLLDRIQARGIQGVVAHAVGDLDGDGLSDLAFLAEPFLDGCEGPQDVAVDVYLTRGGHGRHRLRLASSDELLAQGERCLRHASEPVPVFAAEHWRLRVLPGRVETEFAVPARCGRVWRFELKDGDFHPEPG